MRGPPPLTSAWCVQVDCGDGLHSGWLLEQAVVTEQGDDSSPKYVFPHGKWITAAAPLATLECGAPKKSASTKVAGAAADKGSGTKATAAVADDDDGASARASSAKTRSASAKGAPADYGLGDELRPAASGKGLQAQQLFEEDEDNSQDLGGLSGLSSLRGGQSQVRASADAGVIGCCRACLHPRVVVCLHPCVAVCLPACCLPTCRQYIIYAYFCFGLCMLCGHVPGSDDGPADPCCVPACVPACVAVFASQRACLAVAECLCLRGCS